MRAVHSRPSENASAPATVQATQTSCAWLLSVQQLRGQGGVAVGRQRQAQAAQPIRQEVQCARM